VDFHQGSRARERSSSIDRGSREVRFADITTFFPEPRFWIHYGCSTLPEAIKIPEIRMPNTKHSPGSLVIQASHQPSSVPHPIRSFQ
jgi:hypothetical protein